MSRPVASEHPPAPVRPETTNLGWQLSTVLATYLDRAGAVVAELPGGARAYQVLRIAAEESCRNQAAIAERLRIDRTVMTYLIDDLEAARLIKRQPDPADRRSRRIVLTAKGSRTLADLTERVGEVERELLVDLTPSEATLLRELLGRVATSVAAGGSGVDACSGAEGAGIDSRLGGC